MLRPGLEKAAIVHRMSCMSPYLRYPLFVLPAAFVLALVLATGHLAAGLGPFGVAESRADGDTPRAPVQVGRETPFPVPPEIATAEAALTVDGTPFPARIVRGYLDFVRRQAAEAGQESNFYEWGEILHLFDTMTERIVAARAAHRAGLEVTPQDLSDFSRHTVDAFPGYLEEVYGGSREMYLWDARLQILAKKWMAEVTLGRGRVPWAEAGRMMTGDPEIHMLWDAWLKPARERAGVVTFPERIPRQGDGPPQWGRLFLVLTGALVLGLSLRAAARRPGFDLVRPGGWGRWALSGRLYPEGARAVLLAAFALMVAALAFGPRDPHANLGSVYLWILWWPLVPFALFLAGRSWCAVCPIATLADLVQRLPGTARRRPVALALAGVLVVDLSFILITWLDRAAGLVDSVRLTLAAVLILSATAVGVSLLYRRRTFCRHLCFFGALGGNYSTVSVVELRARAGLCAGCPRGSCYRKDAVDCPYGERPRALTSNRDCDLCLECVRKCRPGALQLRLRDPLTELASVRRPRPEVAVLAALLVGVVAVQNLGMLQVAQVWERRVAAATGLGEAGVATILYLSALALPLLLLALASGFRLRRMALFGYALIPLDLGAHAAHNLLHLLGEGKTVWWVTASALGLGSPLDIPGGHPGGSLGAALLAPASIKLLQVALLLLAGVGSLETARRLARREDSPPAWPLYALLALLIVANLWLLSQPMALRH
jgi:polyferredoxin